MKLLGYSSIWYVKKLKTAKKPAFEFKMPGYFSSLDKTQ